MMPRALAFLLFSVVLGAPLLFQARESARSERAARQATAANSAHARGPSIHRLGSNWTADDGRTMKLYDLRGRLQILALIFTSCPRACPTLVSQLKDLERRLPDGAARFVLVSIDPERDSVDALRAYRKRMDLGEHWTLLRGSAGDVRELAAALGFSYGTDETAQLVHSKLVTVLGSDGEVLHQEPDLDRDPERVLGVIRASTTEAIR